MRLGERSRGLCGGHDHDGQTELTNSAGQVAAQPVRYARRERGDDDFVVPELLDRIAHGEERVGVADDPLDVAAGGLLE
ncbi:MAG TPA: hypothetical protein VIX82_17815 [Solirubrobacteraceae bacterium]